MKHLNSPLFIQLQQMGKWKNRFKVISLVNILNSTLTFVMIRVHSSKEINKQKTVCSITHRQQGKYT